MPDKTKVTVAFRIDEGQNKAMREVAARFEHTPSKMLTIIIRDWLRDRGFSPDGKTRNSVDPLRDDAV